WVPGGEAHAPVDQAFAVEPLAELPGYGVVVLGVGRVVLKGGAHRLDHELGIVARGGEGVPPGETGPHPANQPEVGTRIVQRIMMRGRAQAGGRPEIRRVEATDDAEAGVFIADA